MLKKNNPHDKFVQETLDKKDNAVSFVKNYLPEEIREVINIDSLEVKKDKFVSEELDEYYSDLLYKLDINGKDGYIYLLFEHKSYQDKDIGLQLLKYLLKIWDKKRKDDQKLPVVIPLVIYHGEQEWQVSTHFAELIDSEEEILKKYIPDFEYLLYDLSQYKDKDIIGTRELRTRLEILKYIRSKKFLDKFGNILDILAEEFDIEDIKPIVMYVDLNYSCQMKFS